MAACGHWRLSSLSFWPSWEGFVAKHKFIQKAIRKPGALRATAIRRGLIKPDQKLTVAVVRKLVKSPNATTRRRANLALTLMRMRRRRR